RLHATFPLAPQNSEAFIEILEVLVEAFSLLNRVQKEVPQARHSEAKSGEPQFIGKGIPFSQRQRAQPFIAGDQCLKFLEHVSPVLKAERIHCVGEVENELAS